MTFSRSNDDDTDDVKLYIFSWKRNVFLGEGVQTCRQRSFCLFPGTFNLVTVTENLQTDQQSSNSSRHGWRCVATMF